MTDLQVNVMGTAHFWYQTIDTVLAIQLIVGIGLAVDYSAHIGHCFMTVTGNRNGNPIIIYIFSKKSKMKFSFKDYTLI